jgi:sulfatase maturation enzyme AslB (radical SAM superfamily)
LRSIQSNLTLLTKEIAKLCSENNVQISTSFDFYGNDYSRGNTDKIISNIKLLQQYQKNVSAILVINKFNYEHLVDSYIQ